MPPDTQDVFAAIESRRGEFLAELESYLRIPSISTDPAYAPEIERCAAFVVDRMKAAGLDARPIPTAGHPLVYAEWLGAPGKPTLLFYGHYDVQPPDPLEEWRHPPFEPTLEGDDLVARGATDDKGQSHAHLAAVAAMLRERGRLPVNVKFLIEGEEESGGHGIEDFVRADGGQLLGCDAVVVSDSAMLGPGRPSLLYALRGIAYFEVEVTGPKLDLHSGIFGGAVQNPLHALAVVLAGLKDAESGRVLVPGFYDEVRPLEPWEREEMKAIAVDEKAMAAELGVSELMGESGFPVRERIGGRPTCDVHGLWGGYSGAGAKTVLPARAGAKFSMRLVPDQDPERITDLVLRHVERAAPRGVRVEARFLHGARPTLIDAQGPMIDAALGAMEDVWGRRPVRVREGGSIPIVSTFVDVLRAPVLLLGFGLPDDRLHAPNEKLDLRQYAGGIRSTARLLDRVAAL
jgi:acetylornithine deacetylase/succinyl-diaminopimelate desuccinylase-like protein